MYINVHDQGCGTSSDAFLAQPNNSSGGALMFKHLAPHIIHATPHTKKLKLPTTTKYIQILETSATIKSYIGRLIGVCMCVMWCFVCSFKEMRGARGG